MLKERADSSLRARLGKGYTIRTGRSSRYRRQNATTLRMGQIPGARPRTRAAARWPRRSARASARRSRNCCRTPAQRVVDPSGQVVRAWETRRANVADARAAVTCIRGEGIPGRGIPADPPTWWGAANAVTGWVDHLQPIRGDRYAHALFGAGDRLKSQALELAVEMST